MKIFLSLLLFVAGSAFASPSYFVVTKTTFAVDSNESGVRVFKLLAANDKEAVLELLRGENESIPAGTQVRVPDHSMYHGLVSVYVAGDAQHGERNRWMPWRFLRVDDSGVKNLSQPRVTPATLEEAFQNMLGRAVDLPAPRVTGLPATMWAGSDPGSNPAAGQTESGGMWKIAEHPEPVFQTHEEALTLEACILRAQKLRVADGLILSLYDNLASRGEAFKMPWGDYRFDLKDFPDGTHMIVWKKASGEQHIVFSVIDGYQIWPQEAGQAMQVNATPTPTPYPKPIAVPEPTPQPAPAPMAMRLEMPTPTPAPRAPKSRWDTHQEPTAEEVGKQDLRKAEEEFYNAIGAFSQEERALFKQEEDGWDAYFASIQDPEVKANALRERSKYLRESFAYFKYHENYQAYRDWCKANGKPIPPPLHESEVAPVATPTPTDVALEEQEKAAEQEYGNLWTPLNDKQRIALFQEQQQFDWAFRNLRDHGSPADRIRAYKEEIVRMKAILAGMAGPTDPATAEKLKQKLAELDTVWNSLPPEQQQRVQPGKEGWLAVVTPMAPADQLRETETRIKFLKDNLGQFMRAPGSPPAEEDPVLLAQLQQKQALLDSLINVLPDTTRKQYTAGMKVLHDHDSALPITQRIQHLDVEIQSLQKAAEYMKAFK
jgi:hypothetical protein